MSNDKNKGQYDSLKGGQDNTKSDRGGQSTQGGQGSNGQTINANPPMPKPKRK